jgi:nucleoside-diphosphate-sugar epimerase
MDSMSVAVTGGTGFIGRHLVTGLLAEGLAVRVLTRQPDKAENLWPEDDVQSVVGNLSDKDSLRRLVDGASKVFHLAGEIRDETRFQSVNSEGTKNLLDACRGAEIKRFVHLSSVGVMGARTPGKVDESFPCRPLNAYEASKLEAEQAVLAAWREDNLPVTVARPTIVFGPGRKSSADTLAAWLGAIQRELFKFIGRGPAVANYVYVMDVVSALLLMARHESAIGRIFIVSDSCDLRMFVNHAADTMGAGPPGTIPAWPAWCVAGALEVAGRIGRINPPLNFARMRALTNRTFYSRDLISEELDFQPPFGWRLGLEQTIQWYQQESML